MVLLRLHGVVRGLVEVKEGGKGEYAEQEREVMRAGYCLVTIVGETLE